jgi:hypothetical protein
MIQFTIGNYAFNIQPIPVYGFAAGVIYYDPSLEPDGYDEDDMYHQFNILMFVFGIQITTWRYLN